MQVALCPLLLPAPPYCTQCISNSSPTQERQLGSPCTARMGWEWVELGCPVPPSAMHMAWAAWLPPPPSHMGCIRPQYRQLSSPLPSLGYMHYPPAVGTAQFCHTAQTLKLPLSHHRRSTWGRGRGGSWAGTYRTHASPEGLTGSPQAVSWIAPSYGIFLKNDRQKRSKKV